MVDSKKIDERPEVNLRKQKRTELTRQELLRSARAIFARDGFEHARLEDIASRAGKTRGAFYANFKDKEDVFFAIFEENIDRDMEELSPLLLGLPTIEQRIEALGEYLSELGKDRERILLNLEFLNCTRSVIPENASDWLTYTVPCGFAVPFRNSVAYYPC